MEMTIGDISMLDKDTRLLSKKEMAAEFGVSYRTIERWFKCGYINRILIGGRIYFPYSEVYRLRDQFIDQNHRGNYLQSRIQTVSDIRREQERGSQYRR